MRQTIILALLSITILLSACVDDVTTRNDSGGLAQQMNPNELVGMRGRSMDDELDSRGFSNVGGYKNDGASMTTWWNAGPRQCISVETRQGRVSKAETIVEGNCAYASRIIVNPGNDAVRASSSLLLVEQFQLRLAKQPPSFPIASGKFSPNAPCTGVFSGASIPILTISL